VRRISELRDKLRRGQAEHPAMVVDAPTAYTLQLFASSNRENVDRLVARYPKLPLRVYISTGDSTPYRVLYGEFDSPQAAQEASAKLPAAMLEDVGKPMVRESTEFP
jgi:septal ring-binding cell division protein DamX